MGERAALASTPLQHANRLLRGGEWELALLAYDALWQSASYLRPIIAGNMEYILRNAPEKSLREEIYSIVQNKLKQIGRATDAASASPRAKADALVPPVVGGRVDQSPVTSPLHRAIREGLGVDEVYVVNLARRPDRYIRTLREMNSWGLPVTRVEAVDGRDSAEVREVHEAFKRRPISERRPSSQHVSDEVMSRYRAQLPQAVFAYSMSQARVIRDALKKGHKRILVLDDDVFFCSEAVERINRLSRELPADFKILLLGASEYADRQSARFRNAHISSSDNLYHPLPGETCGSFAVVYDCSVFEDLLQVIDEADGTFDNVMLGCLYNRYTTKCLAVDPAVCIPDVGDSDIRPNARMQKIHSEKMRWEFLRYGHYSRPFHISVLVNSFQSLAHIESLRHELPSEIFLNVFYNSEDGLRPVVVGHTFLPIDEVALPISVQFERLAAESLRMRVPRSDIVLLLPEHAALTEDLSASTVAQALETKNQTGCTAGRLNGVTYCLDAGVEPIPGKHSVIIPAYRAVQHVWPSVRSALAQDAGDFEVIVVNDNPSNAGFSADLWSAAEAWAESAGKCKLSERLHIVEHQRNRNASAARNTGLLKSSGQMISFLDDDDIFEHNRLSAIEESLENKGQDIGATYCGYSGAWNGERNLDRFPEGDLGEHVLSLQYGKHYMCTNTVTFLRSSLQVLGGFNECYSRHQDLELMTRFFEHFRIAAVKLFLVQNRPSPVPETFAADIEKLCRLKHQFLRDMRREIQRRGEELKLETLSSHIKDITKRDKKMSPETVSIISVFLSSALG